MKAKILIPIVVLLTVSVFAGNWIYGDMSAKKLDTYLKQFPENSRMNYQEVKVNPLWSKITFNKFSYTDPFTKITIECEALFVDMKHSEALEISKTRKIDKLTKAGLSFNNVMLFENNEKVFEGEEVELNFKGDMSHEKFKNLLINFPDEKQQVGLMIKNGELHNVSKSMGMYGSALVNLTEIELAEINIMLDPKKKELDLEKVFIKMGEFNLESDAEIKYRGQSVKDFSASNINMKYSCNLSKSISWGDANEMGRYSLKSFNSASEGKIELDEEGEIIAESSNARFGFNLKGFDVKYEGKIKNNVDASLSMLDLNSSDISINEVSFNTTINSGEWVIEDSKIISSILEATINANVNLDKENPDNSDIKEMEMRITNIHPKLNESVNNLSGTFGFKIPREGDDIVLELKGSLKNPKVKGIHY